MAALSGLIPARLTAFAAEHPTFWIGVAVFFVVTTIVAVAYQFADALAGAAPYLPGVFANKVVDAKERTDLYTDAFTNQSTEERKGHAQEHTSLYYDLVTEFFEYGWGQSFHFAPRFSGETFRESIVRHEYALSSRLGLQPGMKVLDAGCGVGGPARNIARFSGAHITGVTINDFQVARATLKAKNEGLSALCEFQQGDFTKLKHADNSFDAAFSIEATCHSPERLDVFAEIFRVLKPGAVFGSYEWVMTPKFDPSNKHHIEIKRGIEIGDSLPDLVTQEECLAAFKAAGFEIVEAVDLAERQHSPVPWFEPFLSHFRLENFKSRPLGLIISHGLTAALEFLHVAPKGTTLIHKHLWTATKTLNLGGQLGIFTPMLFVKVRKPLTAGAGGVAAKAGASAAPSGATRRTGK